MASMGPGFFAIRAKGIELSKKSDADPPPSPLKVESVSAGPTLFRRERASRRSCSVER